MAAETGKSNKKAEKPHALLSPYVRRSALKGLTLFHIDAAIYLSAAYGAIFCNHILLKLSCSLLMGLFTALLFTLGHDACHNSLTPSRTLNKIIGRIAFLPSLHAFSLWDLGHNKTHHRYTNLKGYDYVFAPLSKSEYDSLPIGRRLLERYYRSIWGHWFYYFHQIWWKKMFFASKREVGNRKSIYIADSLLVCVWAIFLITITQLTGSALFPGYQRDTHWFLTFTFLILIPQFVWNCLMTFAIYQHHTHPCVAWYANHEEWLSSRVQSRSSTHIILPKWLSLLFHNIMEHTAHHAHMQVPLYELPAAQAVIERVRVTDVTAQKWTLSIYLENIRKCKLYDYDNHRWVGFDGKPTSQPIKQTLNARLSKSTRCTSTTSYLQPGPINSRVLSICFLLLCPVIVCAQGINYPGNNPISTSGAGNARTDPDNLFTRNNVAGMTEIPVTDSTTKHGEWRFMGELQAVVVRYRRYYFLSGFSENTSGATVANPSFSGEITYTSVNHRYAIGLGISQVFGNQSKSTDADQLGSQGQFYDTKVASNDASFGAAMRPHRKFSVGGTFILGRGFVDQKAPTPQLAAVGIIQQSRLNVSDIGAPGVSVGMHYRPSNRISFGLNFKTKRSYGLEGNLETVQPLISHSGIQFSRVTLNVQVKLKLPSVLETGIQVRPTKKLLFDADYRLYNYRSVLSTVSIIERKSGNVLMTQLINAKSVHLFIIGGVYSLNDETKLHFGSAYITNGIPARFFNPGLYNSGGGEISGGVGKHVCGNWVSVSLMGIFGRDRQIDVSQNPVFAGNYKSWGLIGGFGIRR